MPVNISWTTTAAGDVPQSTTDIIDSGVYSSTLHLDMVDLQSEGDYTCTATHFVGSVSDVVTVSVEGILVHMSCDIIYSL